MVAHLNPTPPPSGPFDHTRVLEDREFLETAVLNATGRERAMLNDLIRTRGFAAIGGHVLRYNARRLLGQHGTALSEASRVLLYRLSIAGHQQPAFAEYTAVPVLCRTDAAIRSATPETVARIALRTVSDVLGLLVRLPQLETHPNRARLEKLIAKTRELCGSLAFAPARTDGPEVETPDEDPIEHGAMLPESGIPDELLFQAVTQSSEVLFTAAHVLVNRATVHAVHDQAALAAADLHYAAIVEQPLEKLLGLLHPMKVDTWIEIRSFIERPGAIQAPGFRGLRQDILEIERISTHPRYPKHEQARIHWVYEALTETVDTFDRWQSMHGGIAQKYTPGGSAGFTWLDEQVEPVRQKRRGARLGTQKASGSCPMGFGSAGAGPTQGTPVGY